MSAIIKNEFSTTVISSFLDKYSSGGSVTDNLYIVIGQPLSWATAPWSQPDDLTPQVPADSFADKTQFEKYAIVAKKIPLANVQAIVPKVVWTSGNEYNLLNDTSADPYNAIDWYALNSLDEVFICVTDPGPGNASTIEPLKSTMLAINNGNNTTGVLADGYEWEYMYTISPIAAKANTLTWMPVSYGPLINILANEQPNSYKRLGVDNIMIIGEIDSSVAFIGDDYRQVAIYSTLVESDGVTLATGNKYEITDTTWQDPTSENDLIGKVGLAKSSMIYLENRLPILRAATQTEELKIVLSLN